jgi:transcriptional regulator with XRE-family HTH domain
MAGDFGTTLRRLRLAQGLSMGQLAERVHFSKGYLSKIENGLKPPTLAVARLCDAALDADGALTALAEPRDVAGSVGSPVDDDVWIMALDRVGEIQFLPLDRRHMLVGGAAAILGLALTRSSRPAAVDKRILPGLRAAFDQVRTVGMVASPVVVLPMLIAQVHALRSVVPDSTDGLRTELQVLASRVAEYTGWMCQEAGDESRASWWTDFAVAMASAGHDVGLFSYALVRHAEMAMYRHDACTTIELARRAQAHLGAGPRILGLAARCEAQGHALAGNAEDYQRALDRALELLIVAEPVADSGRPVLGSSSVPDEVALAAGWSLCDLGRPAQAAEVLDREVPKIAATARRARARFGARRVLAHAANGDVDHACELLRPVLEDAAHVDSATIRVELRQVARTLARWHGHPPVRQLYPDLTAALRSPAR